MRLNPVSPTDTAPRNSDGTRNTNRLKNTRDVEQGKLIISNSEAVQSTFQCTESSFLSELEMKSILLLIQNILLLITAFIGSATY